MPAPVLLSTFAAMTTAADPSRIVELAATLALVALAGAGFSLARSLPASSDRVAPTCSETCGPTATTGLLKTATPSPEGEGL
jgi:hypothetical protein